LFNFLKAIFQSKTLLWSLTKNEFKQKYIGNILGIFWAFIQPAAMIGIFWFVFQVGFKSKPVDNFPFILWLVSGMFPWFYFSEGFSTGTNAVQANGFLVKKVVFRVSLLPMIPILSAMTIHIFFIFFMFAMFLYYGYTPEIYWLQILYYLFATSVLLLGLSWLTSSIVIFFKDIGQLVAIVIQFGFWLTPIFWNLSMVPQKYQYVLKLNPLFYLTEGYRDCMIHKVWFWEHPYMSFYFWFVTLFLLVGGMLIFRKLRPHFADVL